MASCQSYEKAAEYWKKPAKQGLPIAQYNLGQYVLLWRGWTRTEKAVEWFEKAAEQEYGNAQTNLGLMYRLAGRGAEFREGSRVVEKGGGAGNPDAQYNWLSRINLGRAWRELKKDDEFTRRQRGRDT